MYLTAQDEIALKLFIDGTPKLSDIVRDLIDDDKKSQDKKDMDEGEEYYKLNHRILKHEFNQSVVDGETITNESLANEKLVHGFPNLLVRQKIDYIAGKDIDLKIENDESGNVTDELFDLLGEKFMIKMRKWGTGASNKGKEYLHPYIENNEFKFTIIPATQIIPVYDGDFEEELTGIIRYYTIKRQSSKTSIPCDRYKVELWGHNQVLYLVEDDNGEFIKDPDYSPNPQSHFFRINTAFEDEREGLGWGKPPFIELRNNELSLSDLKFFKTLVDNYDFNRSDLSNQLRDLQELFWLVFTDDNDFKISEFIRNIKQFKGAAAPDGAKVDAKEGKIPNDTRKEHTDRLFEDIFIFGMGVNLFSFDMVKNPPSGIALKIMFTGLNLKADALIQHWKLAIKELLWYACEFIRLSTGKEYDHTTIEPVFNKSFIVNDKELIDMINESVGNGTLSKETALEKHPLVDDAALEKERLEKEQEEYIDNLRSTSNNKVVAGTDEDDED